MSSNSSEKISIISIIIGFLGVFASLYALILHIQNLMKPGHGALCDINAAINCSSVIGSSYGELAAIPLGSYGIAYFIILICAAILPKISYITPKQHAILEFILGFIGFISVIVLFYISHSILKTICPTCSVIHILVTIYFVLKIIVLFKRRKLPKSPSQNSDYLIRFISICICLGLPPLAAGLIAPIVIDNFFRPHNVTAEILNKASEKIPSNPTLQAAKAKLINFNKTNYVGDGEDFRRGSDNAKIVVQMFSDFGCPHCKKANDAVEQAQDIIGQDKVLFVYRFFPLSNKCNPYVPSAGWYPYSCSLPQASRCAGAQGKFWEFKEWGFLGQDWTDEKRAQSFSTEGMQEEAKNLGLNMNEFSQCIANGIELNKIKEDADLANKLKIKGTPFILINGEEYTGEHTTDAFTKAFQRY